VVKLVEQQAPYGRKLCTGFSTGYSIKW
jgi:hypothetical protein